MEHLVSLQRKLEQVSGIGRTGIKNQHHPQKKQDLSKEAKGFLWRILKGRSDR